MKNFPNFIDIVSKFDDVEKMMKIVLDNRNSLLISCSVENVEK